MSIACLRQGVRQCGLRSIKLTSLDSDLYPVEEACSQSAKVIK